MTTLPPPSPDEPADIPGGPVGDPAVEPGPPPGPRRRPRLWLLRHNPMRLYDPRAHLCFAMLISWSIGITLITQPGRYANTPSYANLLDVMPAQAWGAIYCSVAAIKLAAITRYHARALTVLAHTIGITLVAVWLVAFIVRYATDDGTTIVNVVSWGTYLYLNVRSVMMLDDEHQLRALRDRNRPRARGR